MSRQHEFPRNISKYNIIEKEGIKLRSPTRISSKYFVIVQQF